jgi:hypothetical protein
MSLVIFPGVGRTCTLHSTQELLNTRAAADQHEPSITLMRGLPVRIASGVQVYMLLLKFKIDISLKEVERLLQEGHISV